MTLGNDIISISWANRSPELELVELILVNAESIVLFVGQGPFLGGPQPLPDIWVLLLRSSKLHKLGPTA